MGINYEPVGRVYLSPSQKMELRIKKMKHWIAILAVSNAIYTIWAILFFIEVFR